MLVRVERLKRDNALQVRQWATEAGETCVGRWHNSLVLNGKNLDVGVNYFEFEQFDRKGVRTAQK